MLHSHDMRVVQCCELGVHYKKEKSCSLQTSNGAGSVGRSRKQHRLHRLAPILPAEDDGADPLVGHWPRIPQPEGCILQVNGCH